MFNLPWFITAHAAGLSLLGLYLTFAPSKSPQSSPLGIATLGLGLSYLSTSYVPLEENQILFASVPVRIILASLAVMRVMVGGVGKEEKKALMGIAIYDGLGALIAGWWLEVWSGRIPGYGA